MTPEEIRAERDQLSAAINFMVLQFEAKTGAHVRIDGKTEVVDLGPDAEGGPQQSVFRLSVEVFIPE